MKYIVIRALCKFSNGSSRVINYDQSKGLCNDIEIFRKELKQKLDTSLEIIGVTVKNISLTYEENN